MNCAACNDLMFDFVYGLLDEPEATVLREHAASCAACAAELEKAKADQLKLGRAALAMADVAPFVMPNERITAETMPLPALDAPESAAPKRRGIRPITMIAWAATLACCAVVAVFMAANHRESIGQFESQVTQLTRQQNDIDARIVSLDAKFALEQKKLPAIVNKDGLQLHVAGPGQVTPGISAGYHVAIRDLDGAPKPGQIEVDFLDAKNQSLARQTLEINEPAEVAVPIDLAKAPGAVRMKVVATAGGKTVGTVEESIVAQKPDLAAHVAVNKLLYKPGDKLQMRALVLDRVTLKPAAAGSKVGVLLVNENGNAVAPALELTTLAGMGAGEIALPANLAEGVYLLEAMGENFAPVRRRIEVLPASAPPVDLLTQNNRYRAGQPIEQSFQLFQNGAPAANTQVISNATIADQKAEGNPRATTNQVGRGAYNSVGQTDAQGNFKMVIPAPKDSQTGLQQLNVELEYGDGKDKVKAQVTRELQVQPSRVAIDFYPEGGQLIAGTANKIFYRVRAPEGDAAASAHFSVHSSKASLFDSAGENSFGSFNFTPDAKETYTLKIASPRQDDIANPFAALGVKTEGLLLRGETVQKGAGPLQVTLENRGPERLVQIVAMSRGQVVAHKRLPVNAPQTPLDIATEVDGVIRVTAFEVKDGQLVPLTERLFFRPARHRLDVVVEAKADKNAPVQLNVKGLDEGRKPLAFWGLASIVDDRFRGDAVEPSLSSHFMLLGEAPSDIDLSELPIINLDGPANAKDLELALGLFGWRRVSPAANPEMMARAQNNNDGKARKNFGKARPGDASGASFFYRVEPSLFEVNQKLEDQWQISQLALIEAARQQQGQLALERTEVVGRLAAARADLAKAERLPRERLLEGLGLAALVLLAVGALAMMYGLSQMVRRLPASGSFGVACGCLAACLALMIFKPQDEGQDVGAGAFAKGKMPDPKEFKLERREAAGMAKAEALRQANAKVGLEMRDAAAIGNAEMKVAARADGQNVAGMRRVADQGAPGQQFARLEQPKQSLMRALDAEMKRGAPNSAQGADRVVVLEQQKDVSPAGAMGGPAGMAGGFGAAGAGGGGGVKELTPNAMARKFDGPLPPAPSAPAGDAPKALDSAKTDNMQPHAATKPKVAMIQPRMIGKPPAASTDPQSSDLRPIDALVKRFVAEQKDISQQRIDLGALTRQFAPRRAQNLSDPATLLWDPAVFVPVAGMTVPVEVPAGAARYRVHIFGHTEDGRLGVYDGILK